MDPNILYFDSNLDPRVMSSIFKKNLINYWEETFLYKNLFLTEENTVMAPKEILVDLVTCTCTFT